MKLHPLVLCAAIAGCGMVSGSVAPTTTEIVNTACTIAESDLPDRFHSTVVDVTAEAVRIMCRAQALRDGSAPPVSFVQMETIHFDCEATRGFVYAPDDDPFRADWYEVCGVQG